jgi:hypothetical protein
MFFTLKSSILVISGYLRTVQVAPGHPVMPCESLGKSLQTCLSQDKSGFPDDGTKTWKLMLLMGGNTTAIYIVNYIHVYQCLQL